jgi:glycosyltransferase involved in cell wall biosynthesis
LNKLTVITVVKNSGDKIKKTIESLRAQIFTDYEHIVHDGGSIDNTVDIIAKYSPMSKITIEKDDGLYEGLNKAIKNESYMNNELSKFLLYRALRNQRIGSSFYWILK